MSEDIKVIDTIEDSSTSLIWLQGHMEGGHVQQARLATINVQYGTVTIDVFHHSENSRTMQITFQELEAINTTIQKLKQAFANYYQKAKEEGEI